MLGNENGIENFDLIRVIQICNIIMIEISRLISWILRYSYDLRATAVDEKSYKSYDKVVS